MQFETVDVNGRDVRGDGERCQGSGVPFSALAIVLSQRCAQRCSLIDAMESGYSDGKCVAMPFTVLHCRRARPCQSSPSYAHKTRCTNFVPLVLGALEGSAYLDRENNAAITRFHGLQMVCFRLESLSWWVSIYNVTTRIQSRVVNGEESCGVDVNFQ